MTTTELQQQIVARCKAAKACEEQFKLLLSTKDNPIQFVRILLNNHSWCLNNGIYTAESLLDWDLEILHRAGLTTQAFTPVDFLNPAEIGGKLWKPLNEGATKSNLAGGFYDYDEAVALRAPEITTMGLLAGAPRQWGLYANTFGLALAGHGNNLFLPAAGRRYYDSGALATVGSYAYYWSSTYCSTYSSYNLFFGYDGTVYPSGNYYRSGGFSIRCVQSE